MGNFDSIAKTIKAIKEELNIAKEEIQYIVSDKENNLYIKSSLNSISYDSFKWMIVIYKDNLLGSRWETLALFNENQYVSMYVNYKNIKIVEIGQCTTYGALAPRWKITINKSGKSVDDYFSCDSISDLGTELPNALEKLISKEE